MQQGRGGRPQGFRPPEPPVVAGRVPPHDLDAEAAVLSAVLLKRDALDQVLEILKPEHFYSEANGRIYEAAMELASVSQPIDTVTVASWLRDRERLQQIGGAAYLAQVVDATPAVAHVAAHARTVREKWRLRRVIAECQRISAEGYGDVGDAQVFIDGAVRRLHAGLDDLVRGRLDDVERHRRHATSSACPAGSSPPSEPSSSSPRAG